jgi:hypothetical protein
MTVAKVYASRAKEFAATPVVSGPWSPVPIQRGDGRLPLVHQSGEVGNQSGGPAGPDPNGISVIGRRRT